MSESLLSPFALDFIRAHPDDAARTLERLPVEEGAGFLEALPAAGAARAIQAMIPATGARTLEAMEAKAAVAVAAALPLESAALLLRRMRRRPRAAVLDGLPAHLSAPLRMLMAYPHGTVGAIMNPRSLTLPAGIRIREALRRLRGEPGRLTHYLYVLDGKQRLAGMLDLRDLLLADPASALEGLLRPVPAVLAPMAEATAVADLAAWESADILPVADRRGIFAGTLRLAALRRALRGEVPRAAAVDLGRTVLDLAELIWAPAASLLADAGRFKGGGTK